MYIRIRRSDAKNGDKELLLIVSKKTQIKQIREMIYDKLKVEIDQQKLYYKGKLLVDDHCIFDYNVQLNDVIQLSICDKVVLPEIIQSNDNTTNKETEETLLIKTESLYYQIGDLIDYRDVTRQWLEAKIVDIFKNKKETTNSSEEKHIIFLIQLEGNENMLPFNSEFDDIRPRSYYLLKPSDITKGMLVLVNHNIDKPNSLGYWYDLEVEDISRTTLRGTLFLDKMQTPLQNVTIKLKDSNKIWRIESVQLRSKKSQEKINYPALREVLYNCVKCKDDPLQKCKECGCKVCFKKDHWDKLLLCDECDSEYHIFCLTPPLEKVPDDKEWYCPSCKIDTNEIVKAGEKLKKTKMKKGAETKRDWGQGMACVGTTSKCTIVSKNHIGSVPGVEVGTCWKFRNQVSEAGIHRPLVAGIHGRESECAYSIVLSGGYEDDVDNGEEFYYTGSGGRDLSGNKRENEQSSDQKLTGHNKALARNCNAKLSEDGGEAKDWKAGKPVRVVRNYKLSKHSKYAPKEGNRYDGLYKVVKYFPEKGLSGFVVWRYFLRRDDPAPAPWTKNGREFEILYPVGYLEAEAEKKRVKAEANRKSTKNDNSKSGQKRKRPVSDNGQTLLNFTSPKKVKVASFELDVEIKKQIENDKKNEKLWKECKDLNKGKNEFLKMVQDTFMCICCQELVHLPVTTDCKHNTCRDCLKRSFGAGIYNCPLCRNELGQKYKMTINEELQKILMALFPGYELSR